MNIQLTDFTNATGTINYLRYFYSLFFLLLFSTATSAQTKTSFKEKPDGVEITKGLKFAILTFSVSTRNAENDAGLLVNFVDQKRSSWEIRADGGYIFKKNLGAGLGISYGQTKDDNVTKASDGTLTVNQLYSNKIGFRPFIKNFIPLDSKNRFFVINQTELQFSFERSVNESTTNAILSRKYSTKQTYGIGLRPGLLVFVVKNFAFETTVDVFGINTSVEKTTATGLPDAKVVKTDVDFRIDILKLAFGFSMYF